MHLVLQTFRTEEDCIISQFLPGAKLPLTGTAKKILLLVRTELPIRTYCTLTCFLQEDKGKCECSSDTRENYSVSNPFLSLRSEVLMDGYRYLATQNNSYERILRRDVSVSCRNKIRNCQRRCVLPYRVSSAFGPRGYGYLVVAKTS